MFFKIQNNFIIIKKKQKKEIQNEVCKKEYLIKTKLSYFHIQIKFKIFILYYKNFKLKIIKYKKFFYLTVNNILSNKFTLKNEQDLFQ